MRKLILVPPPGQSHTSQLYKGASEAMRTEPRAPLRSAAGGGIRRDMRHLFVGRSRNFSFPESGKLV